MEGWMKEWVNECRMDGRMGEGLNGEMGGQMDLRMGRGNDGGMGV